MAHLLVKRRMWGQDMLRSYEVVIDGVRRGKLRNWDFLDLTVPEGPRCVSLRIDGLTSNHLCYFAASSVPAVFECLAGADGGWGLSRLSSGGPWMRIRQNNADDVVRSFLQGLARTLMRRRAIDSREPVLLGDFTYSFGDLSTLIAAAGQHGGMLMTTEGSWNSRLWRHMAGVGWLVRSYKLTALEGLAVYEFTNMGPDGGARSPALKALTSSGAPNWRSADNGLRQWVVRV